jgi:DNA polymerase-3 subunit delta
MDLVVEAELDCKTTGMPAAPIAARAVMRVTEAGRRAR